MLESRWFFLNYHQKQIKRKRKKLWLLEIILKRIEPGVYRNVLQEVRVNDRDLNFRLFV